MKYGFLSAATIASLVAMNVAHADDPEDKIIGTNNQAVVNSATSMANDVTKIDRDIARLEQQLLINQARRLFPDSGSYYNFTDKPFTLYVVGKDWKEVADAIRSTKELRPYLPPSDDDSTKKNRPVGKIDPTHKEVHEASAVGIDYDIAATQQALLLQKARRMFPEGSGLYTWNEELKTVFIFGQSWEGIAQTLKKDATLREYLDPQRADK